MLNLFGQVSNGVQFFDTLGGEGGIRYGSRGGPGQVSHGVQFFDTLGGEGGIRYGSRDGPGQVSH